MKKVIIYSPLFIKGGMETAVYHLARTLIELGDYEVQILYRNYVPLSKGIVEQFREICDTRSVNEHNTRIKWGAVYKPNKQDTFSCDTLINCSNWDFDLPFIKAKNTIHWVHGVNMVNLAKLKKHEKIVVQSKWQSEKLASLGVQSEVLSNIMDEKRVVSLSRTMSSLTNTLPETKGSTYLMVCRIAPEKGWDKLIDFMKLEENKDAVCYVAGVPFNDEGAQIQVDVEKTLKHRVVFLGEIANPYPIMKQVDYVIVPSTFETYGLVSKEAHILGVPVIFNRYETAKDQFIEGFDQWIDSFDFKRPTHHHDYVDTEKQSVVARWEELINAD